LAVGCTDIECTFALPKTQGLQGPATQKHMPTIVESNIGTNHRKLSVTVAASDYEPGFTAAIKQYSKTITLPGFRKGSVPAGVVRKMHGKAIFADEVLRLAGKQVDDYLRDSKVKIFAQPLAAADVTKQAFDMEAKGDYTFDFEIGIQPDFEIGLLKSGASIDAYRVIVTHDMVQEEVERAQYKAGKMSEPETVTHDNDVLNVSMVEAHSDGMPLEGGITKTNSLLMKYLTPAGKALVMGKKKDDTVCMKLSEGVDDKILPALLRDLDLPIEDGSKEKYFNLLLEKIGHVEPAELGETLYKELYPNEEIATEEAFRARLGEEIQRYWDGQGRNKLHNDIFETLVHETAIDIPAPFLKRWLAEGGETPKTAEEVEGEWGTFDHQIRWQLISEKLITEYEIVADRQEIEMGITNDVSQYFAQMGLGNVDPNESWIQDVVAKQMKDKKATADIYNRIVTDKLFHELEGRINIKTQDLSLEEFIAVPSKHHHHH
jgi:trigger factor